MYSSIAGLRGVSMTVGVRGLSAAAALSTGHTPVAQAQVSGKIDA